MTIRFNIGRRKFTIMPLPFGVVIWRENGSLMVEIWRRWYWFRRDFGATGYPLLAKISCYGPLGIYTETDYALSLNAKYEQEHPAN